VKPKIYVALYGIRYASGSPRYVINSRNSPQTRVNQMSRPMSEDMRTRIVHLYTKHPEITNKIIASLTGVSASSVQRVLAQTGLKAVRRRIKEAELKARPAQP
jgi:hypothetical protein